MIETLSPLAQAGLELTRRWCSIPSVRGNDAAMRRQAREIEDYLERDLGAVVVSRFARADGPPVIHARIDVGAARTVILYNMYDVMPAESAGWSVDPFAGGIVDMDGIGPCFVGRGAENNKGPLAGMLCVLRQMLDAGSLQVNVELLIEGEEESGSGALRKYLLDPYCPVRHSIGGLFPSFCEYGGGPPRLYLGFSGIAKGEVRVAGGAWGGPSAPIHSSNAPWIANPASRLVEALARFGQPPTGMLQAIELDAEAREIVATLAEQFDPEAELRFRHTSRFTRSASAIELLTQVLTTASASISSLATEPADADAVIPNAACAKFELRCPPTLDPAKLADDYNRQLAEAGLDGVEVVLADAYPGHRFARGSAGAQALIDAYRLTSRTPQIWPWAIGAAPGYAFARHAESFLIGGAGRGGNAHGANEFMTLDGYERFLASIAVWLERMGRD